MGKERTSSEKLAKVLADREMGYRTLAKLVDPEHVEQARRTIRRWANGTQPTQANLDRLTDALELERGALDPDEDEESLMAPLTRAVIRVVSEDPDARAALRRMLDGEVAA